LLNICSNYEQGVNKLTTINVLPTLSLVDKKLPIAVAFVILMRFGLDCSTYSAEIFKNVA
jgi:hypothetical protein